MSYAKIILLSIRAAVLCGEMQVSTAGKVDSSAGFNPLAARADITHDME
jgi:hypothetical protein